MFEKFEKIFLFWEKNSINLSKLEGLVTIMQNYPDFGLSGNTSGQSKDDDFLLSYTLRGKNYLVRFQKGISQKIVLH